MCRHQNIAHTTYTFYRNSLSETALYCFFLPSSVDCDRTIVSARKDSKIEGVVGKQHDFLYNISCDRNRNTSRKCQAESSRGIPSGSNGFQSRLLYRRLWTAMKCFILNLILSSSSSSCGEKQKQYRTQTSNSIL